MPYAVEFNLLRQVLVDSITVSVEFVMVRHLLEIAGIQSIVEAGKCPPSADNTITFDRIFVDSDQPYPNNHGKASEMPFVKVTRARIETCF